MDYRDAQRFRWITVTVFAVSALVVCGTFCILDGDVREDLVLNGWFRAVEFLAGVLTVAAFTGLPSYLFHPRHLSVEAQNRAIAMSYYTCAPLAFVSWTLPLYGLAVARDLAFGLTYDGAPWLALAATAVALLLWWLQLARLGRSVFRRRWAQIRVALLVPVLWVPTGLLILVGRPWLVLYAVTLITALL